MNISLNGESRTVADGIMLAELIASLNMTAGAMAVAVNRKVVTRSLWGSHELKEGDRVEIVRAIGGG